MALAALVAIAGACAQACYRSAGRLSELGLQSIDVYEKFKRRRGQTPQDVVSEKASRGGYQTGLPKLLSSWAVTGESAFVWRDMVLLWRTARLALVLIFAIIAVISGVVGRIDTPQSYYMLAPLTMVLVGAAAASNMAQAGMKEFLKRNDMVRPLPLSVSRLLRTEALSRSALGVVAVLPGIVTWAVIMPWSLLIAPLVVVFAVGTSFALVSVTTLTCILLPDIEDPTQRSFRQLIQSLGMMLCLSVVVGSFVGLVFATKGLAVPCVVAGVVGGLIGLGALRAAESAYAAYVPSE